MIQRVQGKCHTRHHRDEQQLCEDGQQREMDQAAIYTGKEERHQQQPQVDTQGQHEVLEGSDPKIIALFERQYGHNRPLEVSGPYDYTFSLPEDVSLTQNDVMPLVLDTFPRVGDQIGHPPMSCFDTNSLPGITTFSRPMSAQATHPPFSNHAHAYGQPSTQGRFYNSGDSVKNVQAGPS